MDDLNEVQDQQLYKVGFFTVLQNNLQLHKSEEHLIQESNLKL